MALFEEMLRAAVERRRRGAHGPLVLARQIGALYLEEEHRIVVIRALEDPFFPLTLFERHHTVVMPTAEETRRAARDLLVLSRMFLRIRKDIDLVLGNERATCIHLGGDARQELPAGQWCSFCGDCCQLPGTVPDPPPDITYPGYWYSYIAGAGPLRQRFCPFLFELPPQNRYFCAIHRIKPRTCLRYGLEDCLERHPGKASGLPRV
ncbi:MAG: hypothetical protein JRF59_12990 [Deltaproteobacteria bacterium]|nr:hypothetical protein [Deltaproteobacteria bacterium]MBW1948973.1 hypothetical protein [Deltaproteobacteria bacterium]MBW2009358.1 hypothetical protein [Deltaproteobacteria bacterium]MBW2348739.1 hypothetical protein [Deltaproteobacteria bacterium]